MTTADELIANAKALLLDFDGPVTALMPPPANAHAADQIRASLGGVGLPDPLSTTTDHLLVLRHIGDHLPELEAAAEAAATRAEVEAASVSRPSPEIRPLLAESYRRALPIVIVSNNSEAAVRTFLDRFAWTNRISGYSCRKLGALKLLKPHPHLVAAAVAITGMDASQCVLIGDSPTDIQAATVVGVPTIGVAKSIERGIALRQAGAGALITRC